MRSLGVDLASADSSTAACMVEWENGPPRIGALFEPRCNRRHDRRARRRDRDRRSVRLAQTVRRSGRGLRRGRPGRAIGPTASGCGSRTFERRRSRADGRRSLCRATVSPDLSSAPPGCSPCSGPGVERFRRDGSDGVIEVYAGSIGLQVRRRALAETGSSTMGSVPRMGSATRPRRRARSSRHVSPRPQPLGPGSQQERAHRLRRRTRRRQWRLARANRDLEQRAGLY
jgi:hypothetical protein